MKLYEIDAKLNQLLEQALALKEEGGAVEDLFPDIEALVLAKDDKIANCIGYLKNLRALQNAVDEEVKIQKAKSASLENKIESLEKYIGYFVGDDKWTNGVHSVSWRKSESVEITDEEMIPDTFKEVVIVRKVSKTHIKNFLKENHQNTVEGAVLKINNNIQIK